MVPRRQFEECLLGHLIADARDERAPGDFAALGQRFFEVGEGIEGIQGEQGVEGSAGLVAPFLQTQDKGEELARLEVALIEVETPRRIDSGPREVPGVQGQLRELRPRGTAQFDRLRRQLEAVAGVVESAEPPRGEAVVVVRGRVVGVNGEGSARQVEGTLGIHGEETKKGEVAKSGHVVRVLAQAGLERRSSLGVGALPEQLLALEPEAVHRVPVEISGRLQWTREFSHARVPVPFQPVSADPDAQAFGRYGHGHGRGPGLEGFRGDGRGKDDTLAVEHLEGVFDRRERRE